ALVQHRNQRPDPFQVAEYFSGNIEQHVLAARIVFAQGLGKVTTRSREFALRSAELLEQQIGQARIAFAYPYGVLQAFVMRKHRSLPLSELPAKAGQRRFAIAIPAGAGRGAAAGSGGTASGRPCRRATHNDAAKP